MSFLFFIHRRTIAIMILILTTTIKAEIVTNAKLFLNPSIKYSFTLQNIWALRERISEGVLRDGYVFKYDISLPLSSFYEVVEVLRKRIRDPRIVRISGYGHLGIFQKITAKLNICEILEIHK